MSEIKPDPNYDFVKPLPELKRGSQCGECGQKFEYGHAYGYVCSRQRCPMGFGGLTINDPID